MAPMTDTPSRVLIYRLGSIGDTAVALPALTLVARRFPTAERRMLTNFPVNGKAAPVGMVLNGTGLVHGYLHYPKGNRNPTELLALARAIRAWAPDALVYLTPPRGRLAVLRDAAFFKLCGIKHLIGVPWFARHQRHARTDGNQLFESEADRLLRCLQALGTVDTTESALWDLVLSADERESAMRLLAEASVRSPYLVACIGTKADTNDWGIENWTQTFKRLRTALPGWSLVLVGAQDERALSDRLLSVWQGSGVNLCGRTTPREAAAVMEKAEIFVGHDSGTMHLAAAVSTPAVAVFSARNRPGVWFPHGSRNRVIYHQTECFGCRRVSCEEFQKKCIMSITVDEVLSAIRDVVGASRWALGPAADVIAS